MLFRSLVLSGAIATGRSILAARAMGADLAYMGSAFIATEEANAADGYKQMIVDSSARDVVHTDLFTGVHGNYLKPSIVAAGLDPDRLAGSDPTAMNFGSDRIKPKAWKEVWGCGQGIGVIDRVPKTAELIARLCAEYDTALGTSLGRHHTRQRETST